MVFFQVQNLTCSSVTRLKQKTWNTCFKNAAYTWHFDKQPSTKKEIINKENTSMNEKFINGNESPKMITLVFEWPL